MDNQPNPNNPITPTTMTGILTGLLANVQGHTVQIAQIVDQLKHRGFGPILTVLALFLIVLGAIPMVPATIGVLIVFIAVQMLIGSAHPWIPNKLRQIEFEKTKLEHLIDFTHPYTAKLERLLKNRYSFVFNRISEIVIAITCIIIAVTIITIGFIPMLPALLALPIFMFGIGYTIQDGLVVILGCIFVFCVYGFWWFA